MGVVRGGITMGFPAGARAWRRRLRDRGQHRRLLRRRRVRAHRQRRRIPLRPGDARHGRSLRGFDQAVGYRHRRPRRDRRAGQLRADVRVHRRAVLSTLVLFLGANDISLLGLAPQGTSGLFMAGTVLSAAFFMLVGGRISDTRDSRTPILLTFLVVSFVGFLLLARAESVVSLGLACIFIGAGQGGTSGPMMALLADLTPTSGWVGLGDEQRPRRRRRRPRPDGVAPADRVGRLRAHLRRLRDPPARRGRSALSLASAETGTFLPGRTAGETTRARGRPTEP